MFGSQDHYHRISELIDSNPELVENGECDLSNCSCHCVASLKTVMLEPAVYHNTTWGPSPTPKVKASIIICPIADCNYRCIEDREPLADHFSKACKKGPWLTPSS